MGFEPTTSFLQKMRSTTELYVQGVRRKSIYNYSLFVGVVGFEPTQL